MGPQQEDPGEELPWGLPLESVSPGQGPGLGLWPPGCLVPHQLLLLLHGRAPSSQHLHLRAARQHPFHILSRPVTATAKATATAMWLSSSWSEASQHRQCRDRAGSGR